MTDQYSKGGKEKVIFAISATNEKDPVPTVVMGVSRDAWEYMKGGMCHTFDLTKAGLPIKLILFGGETQADVMNAISPSLQEGVMRPSSMDFAIKPNKGSEN